MVMKESNKHDITLFQVAECYENFISAFELGECSSCDHAKLEDQDKLQYVVDTGELFIDTQCPECKVESSQIFELTKEEFNQLAGEKYSL